MNAKHKQKIEEIMGGMKCPKDFKCAKSGFKQLCKSKDFGVEDCLVCLEKEVVPCHFALSFGDECFCQCPLRIYLGKKLKK